MRGVGSILHYTGKSFKERATKKRFFTFCEANGGRSCGPIRNQLMRVKRREELWKLSVVLILKQAKEKK